MKHLFTPLLLTLAFSSAASEAPVQLTRPVKFPVGYEAFFPAKAEQSVSPSIRRSAPRQGSSTSLFGYLAATNISDLKIGMYSVNLSGGSDFLWQDYLTGWGWTVSTGWMRDDSFWGLASVKLDGQYMGYALVEMDLGDGELLTVDYIDLQEEGMQSVFVSSAYRVADDKVYGYSYDEEGENLIFSVAPADDFHSVSIIRTVSLEQACASLTYDSLTDTMYGVTTEGNFVSVDTEGNQTTIGNITRDIRNLRPGVASGMGWDPASGCCIYDAYFNDNTTALYSLNPADGSSTLLSRSDGAEVYSALFSTVPNASPQAPAKALFAAYDFEGTSLSGSISWTLPTARIDGSSLAGNVSYNLYIDGEEEKSGSAAAGSLVKIDVADVSNSQHTFSLVCSAGDHRGEPSVYRHWVGADAPLPPTNVKLTETTITWDAPAGAAHDGFVDFADVTYTVYLNSGKIGETKETSMNYTLPQGEPFTSYTAEVRAAYKGWTSPLAASNFIQYGAPLNLPVHFRPLEKELEMMTLINVDGNVYDDGTEDTWRFTTEMGFPAFASGYNGDDWLILPPMNLDNTEKAYRFEMEIGLVHDMDTSGTYEVCIGKEPTAEAMTRVIIPSSQCLHMLGDILEEFFAVPEAGVYYIGIHTKTNKVSFHVSDIDVSLSNRSAEVPTGVSGLEAIPGAGAALSANVKFTMPLTTASGKALPADKMLTATVTSYATEPGYDKDREEVETKTLSGLPGSEQQIEIKTSQNYNVIVVSVEYDGFIGKGEETLIYTGVVRPYTVNNLKATVSEDNMTMTLSWTPPTEGEEEGEIGDTFLYVIYDYTSSSWQYFDDAGWDVCEYSFTVPDNYPLSYLTLGVMAYNAAGLSYHISGQSAAVGHPVNVPWTNDLDNDVTYDNAVLPRPTEQYYDTYWMPGDPAQMIHPMFELPSGFAFIGYTDATDRKTRLALPKVTTAGLNDVKLSFDYWSGRYSATMRLFAETPGTTEPFVIAELPKDGKGWTTYTFDLPAECQDQGWMTLYVDADLPDDQTFAMFSGYAFTSEAGVDDILTEAPAILAGKGTLTVSGLAGETLTVTDLQGRTVLQRHNLADRNLFLLPAGLYTVRAGSSSAKVLIR